MRVKTIYWTVSNTQCGWFAWPISVWVSQLCQWYCNTSSWHNLCSSIICNCIVLLAGLLQPHLCLCEPLKVVSWLDSSEVHPDCHSAGVHSCAGLISTLYYASYGHDWISGQHQPWMSALLKLEYKASAATCFQAREHLVWHQTSLSTGAYVIDVVDVACHYCWLLFYYASFTRSHFRPLQGQSEDNRDIPMFPWYQHQILDRQWNLKYDISFL